MKIALCSSFVPFIEGGARNIVDWLEIMLQKAGHHVEKIYLPYIDAPDYLFRQNFAYRWVDLSTADRVICFRPPAYLIPHPHKILWFIHHIRVFYDLWDSPYRGFPDDEQHRGIRDALYKMDTAALQEAKQIFTNSQVVSDRLMQYNQIKSTVLYPPIYTPENFYCRAFNDEIVYVSRIEAHKRQYLLIDAMRHTMTPVKLRLSGVCSSDAYADTLRLQIARAGLQDRIIFDNRWIAESEKIEIFANCLAAAYLPLDEDSYGYPSLEASHSSKPIVTTADSGGVLELVKQGFNGYIAAPDPRELAQVLDKLYLDRENTRKMGENARARLQQLNISWSHVLDRLLA